jgi:hypothetical protein
MASLNDEALVANAKKLSSFIDGLCDFTIVIPDIPYGHMGATICDAMLQAGLNYETVVKPRVERVRTRYPDASSTSGFLHLINLHGAKTLEDFKDEEKPLRIKLITEFLFKKGVESESDLERWLLEPGNEAKLKRERGVGQKTFDYFKWLVGIPTAAVDRHMTEFLRIANIESSSYAETQQILHATADIMNLNRTVLDHSIWKYMSQGKGKEVCSSMPEKKKIYVRPGQAIAPHSGDLTLKYSFDDAWDYVDNQESVSLVTSAGADFEARAGISGDDRPVIRFFQNDKEYARAYQCCWGHYYNCNRTRIGMYVRALDEHIAAQAS